MVEHVDTPGTTFIFNLIVLVGWPKHAKRWHCDNESCHRIKGVYMIKQAYSVQNMIQFCLVLLGTHATQH